MKKRCFGVLREEFKVDFGVERFWKIDDSYGRLGNDVCFSAVMREGFGMNMENIPMFEQYQVNYSFFLTNYRKRSIGRDTEVIDQDSF